MIFTFCCKKKSIQFHFRSHRYLMSLVLMSLPIVGRNSSTLFIDTVLLKQHPSGDWWSFRSISVRRSAASLRDPISNKRATTSRAAVSS